jgi:ribonuclease R
VHRALDLLARGKRPPGEGLSELGLQCSQLERRAEAAERELVKLKLLIFLSSRIGHEMDAVVTGVETFGLFVQGLGLPAEGLVSLQSLPDDTYRFERASHTLSGRRPGHSFRLGDRVRVAVAKVDLDRRVLDFRLVERVRAGARRPSLRPKPSRSPRPKPSQRRGGKEKRGRK